MQLISLLDKSFLNPIIWWLKNQTNKQRKENLKKTTKQILRYLFDR